MKKLIALALALMLVLGLFVGCGTKTDEPPVSGNDITTVVGNGDEPTIDASNNNSGAEFGPLTKTFLETINGGNYHMATVVESEGLGKVATETYYKDGMSASLTEAAGQKTRIVTRDGKIYTIMESTKSYMEQEVATGGETQTQVNADDYKAKFTGDGKAEFAGKELEYEEYTIPAGGKVLYFVDGDKLVGTRTESADGTKVDMEITALDKEIPADIFDLPTDYTKIG
jgi:hypothetical protein